jgi:hypothetical protein
MDNLLYLGIIPLAMNMEFVVRRRAEGAYR